MGIKEVGDAIIKYMPWKNMGAWSAPGFLHYLPTGLEYRRVAPGTLNEAAKPKIPHDAPKLVYDIKYYTRDYRRNNTYSARSVDTKPMDFNALFASAPLKPDQIKTVPRPSDPTRGF